MRTKKPCKPKGAKTKKVSAYVKRAMRRPELGSGRKPPRPPMGGYD